MRSPLFDLDSKHRILAGLPIILEEDNGALLVCAITVVALLVCLICGLCHRKRKYTHQRQFTLNRNIAQFEPTTSLNSSQRHLQSQGGGSSTGSNHHLPSTIPPPPQICITSPSRLSSNHLNNLISVGEVGSLFMGGGGGEDTLSSYEDEDEEEERNGDLL